MNDWLCNSVGLISGVGCDCELCMNLIEVRMLVRNELMVVMFN